LTDYFTDDELACKCDRGDKCEARNLRLDPFFRMKINGIRRELGEAMVITSAIRCAYWNQKVGGALDSQHPKCNAVDVKSKAGDYMRRLIVVALKHGVSIGIKRGMVHLDGRAGPPIVFGY
jgi:uncharacterized protein YcbK (DUF882 family)